MGARIADTPGGMVIQGLGGAGRNGRLRAAPEVQSHGDHRVAMSLAIGALTGERPTTIVDTGCVATSFPGFESRLMGLLTGHA
jgi:3-phosphoshikimate 1-carboxyvinyltransferase